MRYFAAMRKSKIGFCAILGLFIFLIPALSRAQGNLQPPGPLHCLWKAQGASNVVYLLGSVHLLKPSDYPLTAVIESAFTNSQIAVFETDLDKLEDPEGQAAMIKKISLPEGQTLQQSLTPKVYASFSKHAAEVGMPMQMVEPFRPAAAVMTLDLM